MENKTKKTKAIIISLIAFLVLVVVLFVLYKNRDAFGVKTSNTMIKIFAPLENALNRKKDTVDTGMDKNSFWNSISDFLDDTFNYKEDKNVYTLKEACRDGIDNDGDGVKDKDDPNCYYDGDLNGEYVSKHFSESESPIRGYGGNTDGGYQIYFECNDQKDNDGDGFIDNLDSNCHIDGDLKKSYLPEHNSESYSFLSSGEGIDLTAGPAYPTSSTINAPVVLTSSIRNMGLSETKKSFVSFFSITKTKDNKNSNKKDDIELSVVTQAISAGGSITINTNHTFKEAGVFYVRACADKKSSDDSGIITELSEDNNCGDWTTFTVTNVLPITGSKPACQDGIDNDADGLIDDKDPVCHLGGVLTNTYIPEYTSEYQVAKQCNDTIDNDVDGLIDDKDPVCHINSDLKDLYIPEFDSESRGSFECNDTVDNDKDLHIDELDPNCHLDGIITNEYVPEHNSEKESPAKPNVCLDIEQNPITFTDEEKAKLDELLRKFYLISPSLKSETDISLVYGEINNQKNFIGQLDVLIKECYAQTSDPSYTGPKEKYGNPWFNYNTRGSYVSGYSNETTSSYCKNDPSKPNPHDFDRRRCPSFKTQETCERYVGKNFFGGGTYPSTGCTWVETTNLVEYETLLNIW